MNRCDAISDNMTAYRNLYYYLEGTLMDAKFHTSIGQVTKKPTTWKTSGPNAYPCHQESSGEEIIKGSIKGSKKFEFRRAKSAHNRRLGG
jgi:hypothetical protein